MGGGVLRWRSPSGSRDEIDVSLILDGLPFHASKEFYLQYHRNGTTTTTFCRAW